MMPVTITVDDKELMTFIVSFKSKSPEFISRTLNGLATRYRNKLAKEARLRGHYASGTLEKSMVVRRLSSKCYAVMTARYMTALEHGTRKHFIPKNARAQAWAAVHGGNFYRLKAMIAKRGTRPHPFSFEVLYDFYWNEMNKELSSRTERFLRSGARYT